MKGGGWDGWDPEDLWDDPTTITINQPTVANGESCGGRHVGNEKNLKMSLDDRRS